MPNKIEIIGTRELLRDLGKFEDKNIDEMDSLMAEMAFDTQNEAVRSIQRGGRSGRTYKRRGITHTASAAGEPPKSDTGQLVQNITVERHSKADYTVGSRKGAPHGFWLEFGTRFMEARPWLKPAYDKVVRMKRGLFR